MIEYLPMKPYQWDQVPEEQMNPLLKRQVIYGEKMTVARVHLLKGATPPLHSHLHEQFSMVQSGRVRFVVDGKEVTLKAGDMLQIPPHAPHMVEALEDSLVVDIFSPNRDDWQRGDDAYLRR